jgi:hypothetical protein
MPSPRHDWSFSPLSATLRSASSYRLAIDHTRSPARFTVARGEADFIVCPGREAIVRDRPPRDCTCESIHFLSYVFGDPNRACIRHAIRRLWHVSPRRRTQRSAWVGHRAAEFSVKLRWSDRCQTARRRPQRRRPAARNRGEARAAWELLGILGYPAQSVDPRHTAVYPGKCRKSIAFSRERGDRRHLRC